MHCCLVLCDIILLAESPKELGSDGAVCRVEVQFQCKRKQDYGCGRNKWWWKLEDQRGGDAFEHYAGIRARHMCNLLSSLAANQYGRVNWLNSEKRVKQWPAWGQWQSEYHLWINWVDQHVLHVYIHYMKIIKYGPYTLLKNDLWTHFKGVVTPISTVLRETTGVVTQLKLWLTVCILGIWQSMAPGMSSIIDSISIFPSLMDKNTLTCAYAIN